MSFHAGNAFDRPLQTSSESNPPSTGSTDSNEKDSATTNPYRHILTHQEKKKQRMPKRKADSWPASILADADVLSLDDEGRFVLCKVCHVHYAVHGGKKPKPVIMNSGFRTRAWEVHKERTNSHRLHKKHDLTTQPQPPPRLGAGLADEVHKNSEKSTPSPSTPLPPKVKAMTSKPLPTVRPPPLPKSHSDPVPARFTPSIIPKQLPPAGELQHKQSQSPRRRMMRPPEQAPNRPWTQPAATHVAPRRVVPHERAPPPSNIPPPITGRGTPQLGMSSEQVDGLMRWQNMHEDVTRALGSSHKRPMADHYEEGDATPPLRMGETEDFGGNNERVAKKLKSLDDEYDAKVMKRQEAYFDRRSDMYKQYWGTLRDVYNSANHPTHAQAQTHAHAHAQPHVHSQQHAAMTASTSMNQPAAAHKQSGVFRRQNEPQPHPKESVDDFTTPDESGSSEEMVKPVVVHDQALINALDRLTGVISKQFSDRYSQETSLVLDSMGKVANAIDDLRIDQGAAMNRMIQLQEQNMQVMQELLRLKLDKQRRLPALSVVDRSGSGSGSGSS